MSEPGGDANGRWALAPMFWMTCEGKKIRTDSLHARNG